MRYVQRQGHGVSNLGFVKLHWRTASKHLGLAGQRQINRAAGLGSLMSSRKKPVSRLIAQRSVYPLFLSPMPSSSIPKLRNHPRRKSEE